MQTCLLSSDQIRNIGIHVQSFGKYMECNNKVKPNSQHCIFNNEDAFIFNLFPDHFSTLHFDYLLAEWLEKYFLHRFFFYHHPSLKICLWWIANVTWLQACRKWWIVYRNLCLLGKCLGLGYYFSKSHWNGKISFLTR